MSVSPLPYAMRDAARRRDRVLARTSAAREVLDRLTGVAIVLIVVVTVALRLTGDL